MPQETDPLLPNNEAAPEIVGYGFSHKQNAGSKRLQHQYPSHVVEAVEDDNGKEADSRLGTNTSPLATILTIFSVVVCFGLFLSILISGQSGKAVKAPQATPPKRASSIASRVETILSEHPLIDGHNDLAMLIRYSNTNSIYDANFTEPFEQGGLLGHVDLPRLKAGKVGGSFWSAFVPCPPNGSDFSDDNYAEAVRWTFSQVDLLTRLAAKYPGVFSAATPNSSIAAAAFDKQHLLISPFAIEGLHQIGNSVATLRLLHSLNVKYATLTHNCHNVYADAALAENAAGRTIAAPPLWGGVSKRGEILVKEMNRLGMLVDLSHVSKNTMIDVLGGRPEKWHGSLAPIMFSHSSAYSLCPHPRNVQDDVLELVKRTNSIVMVNFSPDFISCVASNSSTGLPDFYPPNSTLHQVARHIMYIGEKIGFDHVGLGSDFDGIPTTPKGLGDVSKFPDLIAELLRMGLTDEDAAKVVGRNILRVWAAVDGVADEMQREGVPPAEDMVVD